MANQTEEQMAWSNSMGTSGFWFYEANTETSNVAFKMSKIYVDSLTKFQRCQIIETLDHGKTLVLDGKTQSAAHDEKVYHESLVHPALMLHPNPKNVYIGGGGEGATMREVLRHKSVEKCVMVDIDEVRAAPPVAPPPRPGECSRSDLDTFFPRMIDNDSAQKLG
jgi:predicted membrane-bound spermidine synthase